MENHHCHFEANGSMPLVQKQASQTFISELWEQYPQRHGVTALVAAIAAAAMASLQSAFLAHPCAIQATPTPLSLALAPARRPAISCSQSVQSSNDDDADAKASTLSSCSRREVLGMGGVLALGFRHLVKPLRADAVQVTCGQLNNATASGLAFCDSQVGTGVAASKGMLIKAHYSGRLENGTEFDSSYKRRKPLTFRVGVGEVIRGWDQGILGTEGIPAMQAGGKRTLKIPAKLGYGERGAGCRLGSCLIPPNSVLIFDVEFVGKA